MDCEYCGREYEGKRNCNGCGAGHRGHRKQYVQQQQTYVNYAYNCTMMSSCSPHVGADHDTRWIDND